MQKHRLVFSVFSLFLSAHVQAATLSFDGDAAYADKNYRMAVVHYHRALREHPEDTGLLHALAHSYQGWGRQAAAYQWALRALQGDPDNIRTLLLVANHQYRQGQTASALQSYQKVLALQPYNKMAQTGVIEAHRARGNQQAAKQAMEAFEHE